MHRSEAVKIKERAELAEIGIMGLTNAGRAWRFIVSRLCEEAPVKCSEEEIGALVALKRGHMFGENDDFMQWIAAENQAGLGDQLFGELRERFPDIAAELGFMAEQGGSGFLGLKVLDRKGNRSRNQRLVFRCFG